MELKLQLLPPQEAIEFFRQKGYRIGFDYRDVWQQEHQAAFTVAKVMELALLHAIREEVDAALLKGTPLKEFVDALEPMLRRRGWWGVRNVVDPVTEETVPAQLGSPRRLQVIYDTNLRTAHTEGQWQRIQQNKRALPYLLYDHTPSPWERPEHAAWDGLVLAVDDPWWQEHMPVRAWGCKCRAIPIGPRQLDRMGGKLSAPPPAEYVDYTNRRTGDTQRIPVGVDPAFAYPPGGRTANLAQHFAERAESAPAAVGSQAMDAAMPATLPALMQSYTRWANEVERAAPNVNGTRRVIGALRPNALHQITEQIGRSLHSAGISIAAETLGAALADASLGAGARAFLYGLPEQIHKPPVAHQVRLAEDGSATLASTYRTSAEAEWTIVLALDAGLTENATTNAIVSILAGSLSDAGIGAP